ncbi:teichoic acid biosynthesis protein C [Phytoactinopolyspora alkaliphila]|uniref:Teichoic acid biosynthesis protein C n=1 Tax=Phytoactinopolyspora alkaliphila TaxID=1783498 RepID=A0A6N9YT60_9ACTN|nr:teichoic acid biosynthesis protein C [Phytoactinopolyspora alkaliphila]NED98018.1 teichoic acid biosynthesis protein C [Phytoactinopolyspora alkaliphila]
MAERSRTGNGDPMPRGTSMSRRRLFGLGAAAATTLAAGAAGAGIPAWATGPGGTAAATSQRRVPVSAWFDLEGPTSAQFVNAGLKDQRTIMQSFAVDSVGGHVYVVQLTQAGTTLPGDEPGDEEYARRNARGDLTMTKLDLAGNMLGHMYLKRFGHGVAIGVERTGQSVHLWTEVDAVTEGASGWGTRLLRFPFEDGAVIDAERDTGLQRRVLVPGVDRTTCNVDPAYRTLVMRYRRDGSFRYGLFRLDHVRDERDSYEPIADVAQPDVLIGTTFQGYATFGQYLYLLDGQIYNDSNPPEGRGNTHLTRVNWRTGEVEQRVWVTDFHELHRREPEGMGVWLSAPGQLKSARLGFAFGTSVTADPADDRLCTILYKDAPRR